MSYRLLNIVYMHYSQGSSEIHGAAALWSWFTQHGVSNQQHRLSTADAKKQLTVRKKKK